MGRVLMAPVHQRRTANDNQEIPVQNIQLEGKLGIAQAESLHEKLNKALANHDDVVLDAESLTQVDASIVQLIHAFVRDAKREAVPVKWKGIPEELRQTADTMGMAGGMGFAEDEVRS